MSTPGMRYRTLGRTGLRVSERGFGAWAIGGSSYGPVSRDAAFEALASAEDLGCNFVDTAAVYGDSEAILGEFLQGRRERWIVASKYSGQDEGLETLVDAQLTRLRTDRIDVYQLHWAPRGAEERVYEGLERVKDAGKVRFIGASVRSRGDLEHVLQASVVDVVQIPVSLVDPEPLAGCKAGLHRLNVGVIARSALGSGFLTGKYGPTARFTAQGDQRADWDDARIRQLVEQADAFSFVADAAGSRLAAAIGYPLAFDEVSTVILGCKDRVQASANLGGTTAVLPPDVLARIEATQRRLGLGAPSRVRRLAHRVARWFGA